MPIVLHPTDFAWRKWVKYNLTASISRCTNQCLRFIKGFQHLQVQTLIADFVKNRYSQFTKNLLVLTIEFFFCDKSFLPQLL